MVMPYDDWIVKRFWEKVAVCSHGRACTDCCWPWVGTRLNGYGLLTIYDKEKYRQTKNGVRNLKAPRLALEIALGYHLPKTTWALHACNNPPCCNCNMGHVYAGSPQENSLDMVRAGHHVSIVHPECIPRGERHYTYGKPSTSKKRPVRPLADRVTFMTPAEVRLWRQRQGWTLREAARYLGVSPQLVHYYETGACPMRNQDLYHKMIVL